MTLASCIKLLYGSQTGNAESISKHLYEEALARGFDCSLAVLDDYEKVSFTDNCVLVIVVSTTGDGDFPDNTTKFFRWTRRGKKEDLVAAFAGKQFTVLALGDTNYTNFCQTGKRIERRLLELGATTFLPKGMADDGTGLEQVVDPWVSNLWKTLPTIVAQDIEKAKQFDKKATASASPFKKAKSETSTDAPETSKPAAVATAAVVAGASATEVKNDDAMETTPSPYAPSKVAFDVSTLPKTAADVIGAAMIPTEYLSVSESGAVREPAIAKKSLFHLFEQKTANDPFEYTANNLFSSRISAHRYLTGKKALKQVLEVTLDLKDMNWSVQPGGVVGILAPNPDEVVLPLLKRLDIDGSKVLNVGFLNPGSSVGALPFVTDAPYTAYEAFRYFLDLNPPLRKPLLRVMAEYATDETERISLLHLTSTAGASLFKTIKQATPSFADLLETFQSVRGIPVNRILESLTRLQPRFYSISQIDETAGTATVAFNIVEYTHSVTGKSILGLCSNYLENVIKSPNYETIPVALFPKPNVVFAPPKEIAAPMILIAAGTGVTPFVSFLQSRANSARAEGGGDIADGILGETTLIHGRRFKDAAEGDRIYGAELDAYVQRRVLTSFIEVLSRDEENTSVKYVQDAIVLHGARICKSIRDGAYVYVCGGVEMARDVHASLLKVLGEHARIEGGEAGVKTYVKALATEGRYLKEIWS
ncbi:hypothetical protein HDU77_003625 [Chytriomyces hyalinus]|nr:hypothetical protein HDU77_003625 [Chytriomyces hyalinus]